jgi:phage N-6-adenine-methyltransferase
MHSRKDGNKSQADEAQTPPSLFKKLNDRFHFELDAFCTPKNKLCKFGFTKENDALKQDWKYAADVIFGNPPYSNPEPFIIKAYEESLKGCIVALLLPADTSTKVFHYYTMKANEIIFIEGRVRFNNPDGTPMQGSPKFGSMVVVFDEEATTGIPEISSMGWK